MRPFSTSKPTWWVGPTGKAITDLTIASKVDADYIKALELRVLGTWLQNSTLHNQYGLYHAPEGFVAIESGIRAPSLPGLWKALNLLEFCTYDRQTGWVWVYEMCAHQMKLPLVGLDNQIKAANAWYRSMPDNPFLGPFHDRYKADLRLSVPRREGRAWQAPSKGLVPVPDLDLVQDPDHARATPAPTAGGRQHRGHVFCGQRLCLPRFLFDEFKGQLGPTWREGQIEAWAAAIDKVYVDEAKPIVDDPLTVWRQEWRTALKEFSRRPAAAASDWRERCPHGGSCGVPIQCAQRTAREHGTNFGEELEKLTAVEAS